MVAKTTQSAPGASAWQAYRLLAGVQLKSMLVAMGVVATPEKAASGGRIAITAIRSVSIAMGVALVAFIFAFSIAFLDVALIPSLAVCVASIVGIVFTFSKAAGALFGFKDYDMTMALPIPTRMVVLARVSALFVVQIGWSAVIMLPMYVAYFIMAPVTPLGIVAALLSVLLSSALPVSISVFLVFFVILLATRFKSVRIAYLVIGIVVVIAVTIFPYSNVLSGSSSGNSDPAFILTAITIVCNAYPLAAWVGAAVTESAVIPLMLFVVVSLLAPVLCVELMAHFFMSINAALSSRGCSRSIDIHKESGRESSPIMAMAIKDLKLIPSIPQYAINCVLGDVFLIVVAIALAFVGSQGATEFAVNQYLHLGEDAATSTAQVFQAIIPWFVAFVSIMSVSAGPALSLEGKSAWVMATAPVDAKTVLGSKILSNYLHFGPALLIAVVIMAVSGAVDIVCALECLLVGATSLGLCATIAQFFDVRRPNYSWNAPKDVLKSNSSYGIATIVIMVLIIIGFVASFAAAWCVAPWAGDIVNIALSIVLGVSAYSIFNFSCKKPLYIQ